MKMISYTSPTSIWCACCMDLRLVAWILSDVEANLSYIWFYNFFSVKTSYQQGIGMDFACMVDRNGSVGFLLWKEPCHR